MINWWSLFYNSLWVVGVSMSLGALGIANYEAQRAAVRLREQLRGPGFQIWFNFGMTLFCSGLLFSSEAWWEVVIWGVLGVAFVAQTLWLWWQQRTARRSSTGPAEREPKPATPRSRLIKRLGWGLILAGFVVLGAWAVVTGVQLYQRAQSLRAHLDYVEQLAQKDAGGLGLDDLKLAGQHLSGMRQDLESVQSLTGPFLPLARLLAWVPQHGGDLAAASDLLQIATGVSAAGDEVFQALAPALELLEDSSSVKDDTEPVGQQLLPILMAGQPRLEAARQELDQVSTAHERIDAQTLSPRVAGLLERLDRYLPWFEMAVDGAQLAPGLLGADGPRTYLILAQNNHELRATGGFISGVGELHVEDGWISSLDFVDSYAVDNLEVPHELAPPAFKQVLAGDLWFFRDTNWNADFPTSARRSMEVYAKDQGVQADGVIALDLTALEVLLDALGPIKIESSAEPVTGESFLAVLQEQWANPASGPGYEESWDEEWWLHRKDFMGEIAGAALDQITEVRGMNPVKLAQAVKKTLDEKHMLLYLEDPEAADLLRDQNWDGALPNWLLTSDFLMAVDTNVGFNKVDANVARSIDYQVDLEAEDSPRASLTLSYQNSSQRSVEACVQEARYGDEYADMMDRCYWNYVRVYVPQGSQLLAGPDLNLPPGSLLARNSSIASRTSVSPTLTEAGWTVWTAFFDLPPGEDIELSFEYELPAWVLDWDADGNTRHRLNVQKQPGTLAVPLHVSILLPAGADLVNVDPQALFTEEMGSLTAATDLRTDREFMVTFRKRLPLP